jgi:hypothetical protein
MIGRITGARGSITGDEMAHVLRDLELVWRHGVIVINLAEATLAERVADTGEPISGILVGGSVPERIAPPAGADHA